MTHTVLEIKFGITWMLNSVKIKLVKFGFRMSR